MLLDRITSHGFPWMKTNSQESASLCASSATCSDTISRDNAHASLIVWASRLACSRFFAVSRVAPLQRALPHCGLTVASLWPHCGLTVASLWRQQGQWLNCRALLSFLFFLPVSPLCSSCRPSLLSVSAALWSCMLRVLHCALWSCMLRVLHCALWSCML